LLVEKPSVYHALGKRLEILDLLATNQAFLIYWLPTIKQPIQEGSNMAIPITCTGCNTALQFDDQHAGKKAKCPKCESIFIIPAHAPQAAPPQAYAPPASAPVPTMNCTFCASVINAAAKKCPQCGETLDPALRAAEEARRTAEMAHAHGANQNVNVNTTVVSPGRTKVVHRKAAFPHTLHLVLTLFTCGAWLPIWLIHYLVAQ